jgi:IS5 family transposase
LKVPSHVVASFALAPREEAHPFYSLPCRFQRKIRNGRQYETTVEKRFLLHGRSLRGNSVEFDQLALKVSQLE